MTQDKTNKVSNVPPLRFPEFSGEYEKHSLGEIGNGIIPLEPFEREYRERTGRILVELASRAEEVERVICGMGQKIK